MESLGDRMKSYERATATQLDANLPIVIRLDGRHFHSFTRGLVRPFDTTFNKCMELTTMALVKETNAAVGYTQSDEITLILKPRPQAIYGGRVEKICSHLAALASVKFLIQVQKRLPPIYANKEPTFDCRCFNVPNLMEAANAVLWRELDAEKNSVSALAQSIFSHKALFKKHSGAKKEMIENAGCMKWDDYPVAFKRGIYVKRQIVTLPVLLENLPPKHNGHKNPTLVSLRTEVQVVHFERLLEYKNRVNILFN